MTAGRTMGQKDPNAVTLLSCTANDGSSDDCSGVRQVELLVRCTGLVKRDSGQATCVLHVKQFGQWKEYARTEPAIDNVNPKFVQTFVLDYNEHIQQKLFFVLCGSTTTRKEDAIGMTEIQLHQLLKEEELITTTSRTLRVPGDAQSRGWLHVIAEVVKPTKCKIQLHAGATKLKKSSVFQLKTFDTYLEVGRSINSIDFHPIYRSEVIHKCREPRWRPFDISLQSLCNGSLIRPIEFSCWQIRNPAESRLLGSAVTTVQQLQEHGWSKCFKMLQMTKISKSNPNDDKQAGMLKVMRCRLDMQYSLLDYVRGGCSCNFMVAIDFTSSNGDPTEETSLHYQQSQTNPYVRTLQTLGTTLAHCDLSKKFAAFGFGARHALPATEQHCFPLNATVSCPYVNGIEGVLEAYRAIVPKLKFGGPSQLSPVIQHAMKFVEKDPTQENQFYNLLLIITDGVVNDIDSTIDVAIEASQLPLSIVIVGVGPSDFTTLQDLSECSSSCRLKSHTSSRMASRDNIHFVPFHKQMSDSVTNIMSREALARVSRQLTTYMHTRSITPQRASVGMTARLCLPPTGPDRRHAGSGDHMARDNCSRTKPYNNVCTVPSCPTCGAALTSMAADTNRVFLRPPTLG